MVIWNSASFCEQGSTVSDIMGVFQHRQVMTSSVPVHHLRVPVPSRLEAVMKTAVAVSARNSEHAAS
jgi:hypothetical protein